MTQKTGLETLSTRAKNGLATLKIHTLQELIDFCTEYGIKGLEKTRSLGPKSILEIRDILDSLHNVSHHIQDFVVHKKSNFFIIKDIVYADPNLQNIPLENLKFVPARAKRTLKGNEIFTLKDLIDFFEQYGFESVLKFRFFGKKTLFDILYVLEPSDSYLDEAIREIQQLGAHTQKTERDKTKKYEIAKNKAKIISAKKIKEQNIAIKKQKEH